MGESAIRVGEYIRLLQHQGGLSQEKLAFKVGINIREDCKRFGYQYRGFIPFRCKNY